MRYCDWTQLNQFIDVPSFNAADTNQVRLKKLKELREFIVSNTNKLIKLMAGSYMHSQYTAKLCSGIAVELQ